MRSLIYGLAIAFVVLVVLVGFWVGGPWTKPQMRQAVNPSADQQLAGERPAASLAETDESSPRNSGTPSATIPDRERRSTGTDPILFNEAAPADGNDNMGVQIGRASADGETTHAARATRNVTPPAITPGPAVTGPLIRIPVPVPPKTIKRVPKRFRRIVVADARTLQAAGMTIRLAGIVAPGLEETCGRHKTWPCGRRARTALRKLIRARAIECAVTERISEMEIVSTCRVGRTDLAQWLAKQGWAKPAAAAPEAVNMAADEAKRKRRGLWRGIAE